MALSKYQKLAILSFIIGIIVVSFIYHNLDDNLKNIVSFFTIFGTLTSVFGILFAYLQIHSTKDITEITNKAAEETRKAAEETKRITEETRKVVDASISRMNKILAVSELSKANKIIEEIQTSIRHEEYALTLVRMKDLKSILLQVKNQNDVERIDGFTKVHLHIRNLGFDMISVSDYLPPSNKKGINFSKVNKNLEELSTYIKDFENKLKYQRNDT